MSRAIRNWVHRAGRNERAERIATVWQWVKGFATLAAVAAVCAGIARLAWGL